MTKSHENLLLEKDAVLALRIFRFQELARELRRTGSPRTDLIEYCREGAHHLARAERFQPSPNPVTDNVRLRAELVLAAEALDACADECGSCKAGRCKDGTPCEECQPTRKAALRAKAASELAFEV